MQRLKDSIKSLLGYTIDIKWLGNKYTVYCWTRKEAVEVMRAWPIEARVLISHSLGKYVIAARRIANV